MKNGIVEQVKSANSTKEVNKLVEKARNFKYISAQTLRRVSRKAQARLAELE